MEIKRQLAHDHLIRTGRDMAHKELVSGRSGNISVRLASGNILITSKGSFLGMLGLEDLVEINIAGDTISGSKEPSSEKLLHLGVYRARPDVNAVVHTHSHYASAYALTMRKLKSISYESDIVLGDVPVVPYLQPGTQSFADAVRISIGAKSGALLQRHGTVAVGENIFDALAVAELIEDVAKINYLVDMLNNGRKNENDRMEE